jgi:hypothetical protein
MNGSKGDQKKRRGCSLVAEKSMGKGAPQSISALTDSSSILISPCSLLALSYCTRFLAMEGLIFRILHALATETPCSNTNS